MQSLKTSQSPLGVQYFNDYPSELKEHFREVVLVVGLLDQVGEKGWRQEITVSVSCWPDYTDSC